MVTGQQAKSTRKVDFKQKAERMITHVTRPNSHEINEKIQRQSDRFLPDEVRKILLFYQVTTCIFSRLLSQIQPHTPVSKDLYMQIQFPNKNKNIEKSYKSFGLTKIIGDAWLFLMVTVYFLLAGK